MQSAVDGAELRAATGARPDIFSSVKRDTSSEEPREHVSVAGAEASKVFPRRG